MRIISGKFKGKSIHFIKSKVTRPLRDMVKENIFNILSHSSNISVKIDSSNVLDLYSGVGSFGLECISREANQVTFVENNDVALNLLKKNIKKLSINQKVKIFSDKIESLKIWNENEKYNIFFLDPPYADKSFIQNLKIIKEKKIYKKNHILIIHRERNTEDNFSDFLKIFLVKNYGRSRVIFGHFI